MTNIVKFNSSAYDGRSALYNVINYLAAFQITETNLIAVQNITVKLIQYIEIFEIQYTVYSDQIVLYTSQMKWANDASHL